MECEHLVVELETRVVQITDPTTANWFTCTTCGTKAVIIERLRLDKM